MKNVASLVLGIVSCALGVISWFILWWLAIPALICGIVGLILKDKGTPELTLNIVGTSVSGLSLIVFVILLIVAACATLA